MMKMSIALGWMLVAACSASHSPDSEEDGGGVLEDGGTDGAINDAGSASDADVRDALAPRCSDVPAPPCLELASTVTFRTGEEAGGGSLQGLGYHDGPAVLYQFYFDMDGSWSSQWRLQRFTTTGSLAGDPLSLTGSFVHSAEWGGDVGTWDGELVVAWREERPDGRPVEPATVAFDTYVSIGGAPVTDPIQSVAFDATGEDGIDVALAAGLVITDVADGLLVSRIDGPGDPMRITTERAPFGKVRASALGPHHAVITWSEDDADGFEMALSTEAVVVQDSMVTVRSRIFQPSPGAIWNFPHVVVIDEDVWVARYDLDSEHLRESRIRVAHLDTSLRRLEPDRWFAGWGGLNPGGVSLVAWQGAPWLVWRTLDARYGASTVLYARPIPEPACGYDVSDPVVVWRPEAGVGTFLLATASTDALWITVPQVSGDGTADLYQLRSCD